MQENSGRRGGEGKSSLRVDKIYRPARETNGVFFFFFFFFFFFPPMVNVLLYRGQHRPLSRRDE